MHKPDLGRSAAEAAQDVCSVGIARAVVGTAARFVRADRAGVTPFGLEGAVAKRVDSRYEPGERSDAWLKVKFQLAQEFVIGGFTPDGDRVDAWWSGTTTRNA